jgi:hypothetical protein
MAPYGVGQWPYFGDLETWYLVPQIEFELGSTGAPCWAFGVVHAAWCLVHGQTAGPLIDSTRPGMHAAAVGAFVGVLLFVGTP